MSDKLIGRIGFHEDASEIAHAAAEDSLAFVFRHVGENKLKVSVNTFLDVSQGSNNSFNERSRRPDPSFIGHQPRGGKKEPKAEIDCKFGNFAVEFNNSWCSCGHFLAQFSRLFS